MSDSPHRDDYAYKQLNHNHLNRPFTAPTAAAAAHAAASGFTSYGQHPTSMLLPRAIDSSLLNDSHDHSRDGDDEDGSSITGGNHDELVTYVQSERIGFVPIASGTNNHNTHNYSHNNNHNYSHSNNNHSSNNHSNNINNNHSNKTSSPSTIVANGGPIHLSLPPPSSSPVTRPIAKKHGSGSKFVTSTLPNDMRKWYNCVFPL